MKITKKHLKQLIHEELSIKLLNERPADTAMYTPPPIGVTAKAKPKPAYRGEVGFGNWESMSFDDPKVSAAMSRVKNHLNKFVENGTFKKAAAESGVSERLIYGTVFDELMRATPTDTALEKAAQSLDDSPTLGWAMATGTDMAPFFDRKEPAVGIASIKPRALFDLIDAGYLKDLDIPEKVRGGGTRAALDWIQNNPEASIQVVAARHKKKRDDWSNLKDSGRDVGYEPDEATLAQMYSLSDKDTQPLTQAQRIEKGKAADPAAGLRGTRVTDIYGQMGYPDLRTSPIDPVPEPDFIKPLDEKLIQKIIRETLTTSY